MIYVQHIDSYGKAKRLITLCHRCKSDYISSGYQLTFTGKAIKSECDMCSVRMGFDYYLEDTQSANKAMR
jgi:hypothetical protein